MKKLFTIAFAIFLLAYFTGCTTYTTHTTYADGSSQDYTTVAPDYSVILASLFLIPLVFIVADSHHFHHHHHHHHGPAMPPPAPRGYRR